MAYGYDLTDQNIAALLAKYRTGGAGGVSAPVAPTYTNATTPDYTAPAAPSGVPTAEPKSPKSGQQWFDPAANTLKTWDESSGRWAWAGSDVKASSDPNVVNPNPTLPNGQPTTLTPDETAMQAQLQNLIAQGQTDKVNAAKAQTDLVSGLTTSFANQMGAMQSLASQQIGALTSLNTSLVGDIQGQQQEFAKSQEDLQKQISDNTASQSKAMSDLVTQLRNGSSQAAKKPNYASAMARNRALNAGGLGSTMLSGPSGVAPTSLTLGRTSLLGV